MGCGVFSTYLSHNLEMVSMRRSVGKGRMARDGIREMSGTGTMGEVKDRDSTCGCVNRRPTSSSLAGTNSSTESVIKIAYYETSGVLGS